MTQITTTEPVIAREVALTDDTARSWLESHGWHSLASQGTFQLFADVVRRRPFVMGRIWHTPATLALEGLNESYEDDSFIAIIGIDGRQTIRTGDTSVDLLPGQLYLQPFNQRLEVQALEPVARVVFISEWSRLRGAPGPTRGHFTAEQAYTSLFVTAANSALAAITPDGSVGIGDVQRSLEHLFLSMLQSERDLSARPAEAPSLVHLSRKVIDAHASNPHFSASNLARALNVSLSTLYRAYEQTGTSPAHEIRSHRLARARRLLSCVREPTPSMLAEVARLAGFGSLRSMHRARLTELGVEDPSL